VCFLSLQHCTVEEVDWLYVEMTLALELGPQPFIFVRTNYHQRKVVRAVKFFPSHYILNDSTGWTVRGSHPGEGGEIFPTRPDQPWGSPDVLCNGYPVSFSGESGRSVTFTIHLHLAPRLKKE